MDTKRICF